MNFCHPKTVLLNIKQRNKLKFALVGCSLFIAYMYLDSNKVRIHLEAVLPTSPKGLVCNGFNLN